MIVHDGDNYLLRFRKECQFSEQTTDQKRAEKDPSNSHLIIDSHV